MMDPFTQANPFLTGGYGMTQGPFGQGSQGNIPFGISPPWGNYGLYSLAQQGGGSPFLQTGGYGQNPYQNPYTQAIAHHLSQLPPQTWLGPLLYGSPWQHQYSPWAQGGFGGQQQYGPTHLLPQLLLQSLYSGGPQQGFGQFGQSQFNRPPFGFGGYPFA